MSFITARTFVHSLELKNTTEWKAWAKSGHKPQAIPTNPQQAYKKEGWIDFADFLGTKAIANRRTFRSFTEAREFARSLGLKGRYQWLKWFNKNEPQDLPKWPNHFYLKKGWAGWNDFLNTEIINRGRKYRLSQSQEFRSFEEARNYARSLGLKSMTEWKKLVQLDALPSDIPSYPNSVYKTKGWKGTGDFLGTGYIASQNREFLSYENAKKYMITLGLCSMSEFRKWTKSESRPQNIPASPWQTYAGKGWSSIGDFLGTGVVAPQNRKFRSFQEARIFTQSLGFSGKEEWVEWAKSDARPTYIPGCPNEVYAKKGWDGWGDFLGTGFVAHKNRKYRSFYDARIFVRSLGLQNKGDWFQWAQSSQRPEDIPQSPAHIYADEWINWGDWLGTARVANQNKIFRPFEEARTFVRSLGLKNQKDWREWVKTSEKPDDIPANPSAIYQDEWLGWGDWLGIVSVWNKFAILAFVKSLLPLLHQMSPDELYSIMKHNKLIDASKNMASKCAPLLKEIVKLAHSSNKADAAQKIADCVLNHLETDDAQVMAVNEHSYNQLEMNQDIDNYSEDKRLPELKIKERLSSFDRKIINLVNNPDESIIEYLIAKEIANYWKQILSMSQAEQKKTIEMIKSFKDGVYSAIVKERFIQQYDGACALETPKGYAFSKNGKIVPPNLMQQLVAFRIKNERSLGNWSGAGAGKTLAAILASRVIEAKLTIVITLNNTLDGWRKEILQAFPGCQVFLRKMPHQLRPSSIPTYLILNYEAFQQKDSSDYVEWLVGNHIIDFVVLDEIQSAKKRGVDVTKRRNLLEQLLFKARFNNVDLCTLGMSATPVINSLDEAVSLLNMIKGEKFKELKTFPSLENCISIHEQMVLNGVRHVPLYQIAIDRSFINIQGQFLLEKLQTVQKNEILKLETYLLEAKLPAIDQYIKPGTIIYTQFVDGLVKEIKTYLRERGWSHGEFTGNNKEGLHLFLEKKIDVLVASSAIGTGLDGLQYVCDQLIILSLPWTSSAFDQLEGRIYRQGSAFTKVKVIIPQVVLINEENEWSWDKQRMNKIKEKKTLGDAVLDGIIPEDKILTPGAMLEESRKALSEWIQRLENKN